MTTKYKLIEPTFEAVTWTGGNEAEIVAFMQDRAPAGLWSAWVIDEENSNGDPDMVGAVFLRSVPPQGLVMVRLTEKVVYGPVRGTSTADASFSTLTGDDFAAQYAEVV